MADAHSTPFVALPAGKGDSTVLVDASEAAFLKTRRIHVNAGGYAYFYTSRRWALHRWIMQPPDDMVVDHINGDPLDNRRSNLRICTHAQNLANGRSHRDSTSKYRGVSYRPREGTWRAQISVGNQRSKFLGQYRTEEEAALAYDAAARDRYGEYARLNFPGREAHQEFRHYLTREERRALGLPMKNMGGPGGIRTHASTIMSGLSPMADD